MDTANNVFKKLAEKYTMSNLGELHYFCGIELKRDRKEKTIFCNQKKYTMEILERFGMLNSIPKYTPLAPGSELYKPTKESYTWPIGDEEAEYKGPYREKVGSLLYLALVTRPDIACAVGKVAQFSNCPTIKADKAVQHIFRYINGTRHFGITLGGKDIEPIHTFCDAAHTTDPGMKSITGYVIRMGESPIIWSSKKQVLTTMSTMESELDALAHSVIPSLWLRDQVKDLSDNYTVKPITILQDNQGTIQHCKNEQSSYRTAHLQRRYHFVKQYLELEDIVLKYLPGTDMPADQLTKILPREVHERHCRHYISTSDRTDPFDYELHNEVLKEFLKKRQTVKKIKKEKKVKEEKMKSQHASVCDDVDVCDDGGVDDVVSTNIPIHINDDGLSDLWNKLLNGMCTDDDDESMYDSLFKSNSTHSDDDNVLAMLVDETCGDVTNQKVHNKSLCSDVAPCSQSTCSQDEELKKAINALMGILGVYPVLDHKENTVSKQIPLLPVPCP